MTQLQAGNSGAAWLFDQVRSLITSERTKDQRIFDTVQLTAEKKQAYVKVKSTLDVIQDAVHRLPRITREMTGGAYVARLNQAKMVDLDNDGGTIDPFQAFL
jgi:hypothetical protein